MTVRNTTSTASKTTIATTTIVTPIHHHHPATTIPTFRLEGKVSTKAPMNGRANTAAATTTPDTTPCTSSGTPICRATTITKGGAEAMTDGEGEGREGEEVRINECLLGEWGTRFNEITGV